MNYMYLPYKYETFVLFVVKLEYFKSLIFTSVKEKRAFTGTYN